MKHHIIFPEANSLIKTIDGKTLRLARDFEAGSFVWVYEGGLDLDVVTGEHQLACVKVIELDGKAVSFNGIQFELN